MRAAVVQRPRFRRDDTEFLETVGHYFSSAVRSVNDVVSTLLKADPEK